MAGYIGTKAAVVTPGAERKKVFSITTTTTSLTGLAYTPGFVHVFHNGVRLVDGTDYTATNGTSLTLTTAAQNGDEVVVVSLGTFQVADAYTKAEADGRYVNVTGDTMTGALAVNGNLTVDTNTMFVDAATNRVGIGATTLDAPLTIKNPSVSGDQNILTVQNGAGTDALAKVVYNQTDDSMKIINASTFAGSYMGFWTNNTQRMQIDSAGRVTMPYQPVFNVYKNDGDNQSVVGATVVWNGTAQNIGGHYSTSTGRFTAPVAGTYFFTISVMTGSLGNYGLYQLRKNDGVVVLPSDGQWAQAYVSDTNDAIVSASGTVYLSAGDFVSVFVASSYPNFYWAGYNNFSGYLLG